MVLAEPIEQFYGSMTYGLDAAASAKLHVQGTLEHLRGRTGTFGTGRCRRPLMASRPPAAAGCSTQICTRVPLEAPLPLHRPAT